MHCGNEYNTVELADQLIANIGKRPDVIPSNVTLYILHDLNPDGLARAHNYLGRANANGVDLNRNWRPTGKRTGRRGRLLDDHLRHRLHGHASEPETKG